MKKRFWVKNLDATACLRMLKSESVDLLITDPAYESLDRHRNSGSCSKLSSWFDTVPNSYFEGFFKEAYRVLKNNTHMYILCDQETMFAIKPMAERVGFRFWKPIIWDKVHIGMGYHYRNRHEFILFFEKGKRPLADLSVPDIITHNRVYGGYPTEKPEALIRTLILQSSEEGEIILDPFMGSGSTGLAALRCDRLFIGNDKSKISYDICVSKFSESAK